MHENDYKRNPWGRRFALYCDAANAMFLLRRESRRQMKGMDPA